MIETFGQASMAYIDLNGSIDQTSPVVNKIWETQKFFRDRRTVRFTDTSRCWPVGLGLGAYVFELMKVGRLLRLECCYLALIYAQYGDHSLTEIFFDASPALSIGSQAFPLSRDFLSRDELDSVALTVTMFSSALKSFQSNISANYSIASQPTSVSGAWQVFDGQKKSSGKAVSVFLFERKSLDPHSSGLGAGRSGGAQLRKLHDEVVSRIKKECSLLARLRHPCILELAEPIEDTRSGGLMFATEPVTASLAGLLQEKDDQEKAGGIAGRPSRYVVEEADGQRRRRELELDELEIQKGLLQVAQGLEFLHESAGLVHGNLTPDAIYVNVKVCSKIFFSSGLQSGEKRCDTRWLRND